jgi:hypothetical protein
MDDSVSDKFKCENRNLIGRDSSGQTTSDVSSANIRHV